MTTISIRTTESQKQAIAKVAELYGKTVSSFLLDLALEKIEDEFDLKVGMDALTEYENNAISYSFEEMKEMHGL